MKFPQDILAQVTPQITVASFSSYYGEKADVNLEADRFLYPAIFLDTPIKAKGKRFKSNAREISFPISLMVVDKHKHLSKPEATLEWKKIAFEAFKQFELIALTDKVNVKEITDFDATEINNFNDVNLCGWVFEFNIVIKDAGHTCV